MTHEFFKTSKQFQKRYNLLSSFSLFLYGAVIRFFVTYSNGLFSFPNHQYSPIPLAIKSLRESLFIHHTMKDVDVYDSPVAYQTPLVLLLFSFIPDYLLHFVMILLDLFTACILKQFVDRVSAANKNFEILPRLIFAAYLFNPFLIASAASGSLIVLRNLFLALMLFQSVSGDKSLICSRSSARRAMFYFAIVVYLDWNYIVLMGALLLLLKNGIDEYFLFPWKEEKEDNALTNPNAVENTTETSDAQQNQLLNEKSQLKSDIQLASNDKERSTIHKRTRKKSVLKRSDNEASIHSPPSMSCDDDLWAPSRADKNTQSFRTCSRGKWFVLEMVFWFLICLGLLAIASYFWSGKSWRWIDRVYGRIFRVEELSPNWGNYWYFFLEVFEDFRRYFILLFNLQHFAFVVPLFLRLKRNPIFLLCIHITILSIFLAYPSFGGIFFALTLRLLFIHLSKFSRYTFILLVVCVYTCVSGPSFFRTWVYTGTGNANFFYFMTLGFLLSQIMLIIDTINSLRRWEHSAQTLKRDREMSFQVASSL